MKKKYYTNLLDNSKTIKNTWSILNSIINPRKPNVLHITININGKDCSESTISNKMNYHLTQIGNKLADKIYDIPNKSFLDYLNNRHFNSMVLSTSLFFIIFINDISNIFNNDDNINLNIYADDTSLSIFANSNEELSSNMQLYLDRLCHWFNINKLKLNIEKTKILPYFNTKIINNINLNNANIEIVDRYTFLGIILDSNLTYSFHIINLCNKLSKIVYLFRKLKFLNIRNLIILYNSLFLSNMSYGIEIWGNVYEDRLQKLVLIQKKTIRIINKNMIDKSQLPLIRLSHTNNMFKYNSILKLNELISFRIILFLYNLLHNNYNINLDTFFIYNKDKSRFILPLMKTTKFQNTIFFKGPKYYNNIMSNNILKYENIHNIHKLKKVLKNYFLNKY